MTATPLDPTNARLVDLYLRLSNADDDADSIERQESDLREWARREALTVREVWVDYGVSGYKDVPRVEFEKAAKAVTSGEVGTLAVWKLDRLSRRGSGQVGLLLDAVEKAGGRLFFLKDGLDTSAGASARIPITVLSEIARAESANTSLRVRDRKAKDRAKGRYLGGAAPIGYVVGEDRRLRPHPMEAALVRELVDRLFDGETMLAVARDWNAREIPTRRRGAWRSSTLSTIVRSPTLAGLMTELVRDENGVAEIRAYRDPTTGEHVSIMAEGVAPIATEGEQARLLAILDARLRQYGRGRMPVRQPKSLLGLLAKCESCERTMNTFGDSYRCRKNFATGGPCPAPTSVSIPTLEEAVRIAWAGHLAALDPDDAVLGTIADRWLQKFDPAPLQERSALEDEIRETSARLAKADADHYERGILDAERHERVTAGLTARLAALRERLAELPRPEADLAALLDPELSLPAIRKVSVTEARDLLRLAIEAVYVSPAPKRGARFDSQERLRFDWVS